MNSSAWLHFFSLRSGLLLAIRETLRVRESGLLCAGPPCGSFVFLNMATSGRSKRRPFGNSWAYVKQANRKLGLHRCKTWFVCSWVSRGLSEIKSNIANTAQLYRDLRITCRLILILMLATVRCVWTMVEQPGSTTMLYFPYLVWWARVINKWIPWQRTRLSETYFSYS